MEIKLFPKDQIYSVCKKRGNTVESDFFLRAVHIKNNRNDIAKIQTVLIDVRSMGESVKQFLYPKETLENLTEEYANYLIKLSSGLDSILLGEKKFWTSNTLSPTSDLVPGHETGLMFQHFKIYHKRPVDEMQIFINYKIKGKDDIDVYTLPIKQYKPFNKFIFPVKGAWITENTYDYHFGARRLNYDEFSFDLVKLNSNFFVAETKDMMNKQYAAYGKRVFAAAKGTVVETFTSFPENPKGYGSFIEKTKWASLIEKYGLIKGLVGNHIIIEHPDKEYTFYGNLMPKSFKVRKGDFVEQGAVIALVGNSGNSTCPRLHFNLMSGGDILTAHSLPAEFINLRNENNEPLKKLPHNKAIVHAFL